MIFFDSKRFLTVTPKLSAKVLIFADIGKFLEEKIVFFAFFAKKCVIIPP